ncbi:MAG: purine-nucleoside phosphorylase [Prevotella sp.]|nr:purine-nucleoside phosphorylase [Prevotella sp.]MCD8305657.1 purine-nucleoside phosphorylase [Prevotella sp.]
MATPHNNAVAGAYGKTVLMPGDPLRAKFVADNFLSDAVLVNDVRNCFGFTGTYKGVRVSVQASGMGMPSIGIYSYELFSEYGVENIIRIGSAGSYTARLDVNDVVLAESSYSESSYALVHNGYQEKVNYPSASLNERIINTSKELGIVCKPCRVHSSDVFYTCPGRESYQELAARTQTDCVEMESFALFHNAAFLGKHAACLLTISDSFVSAVELSAEERQNSFRTMMTLALEAAVRL